MQPQNDPWSVPTTSSASPAIDPWTPVPPQRPSESHYPKNILDI